MIRFHARSTVALVSSLDRLPNLVRSYAMHHAPGRSSGEAYRAGVDAESGAVVVFEVARLQSAEE
jgi:hypothetical protein